MKPIKFLMLSMLGGLLSCSEGDSPEVVRISPGFEIEYIDKPGSNLIKNYMINNPDKITELGYNTFEPHGVFEIISITDHDGDVFEYTYADSFSKKGRNGEPCFMLNVNPRKGYGYGDVEKQYTIKYKLPFLLGEDRIEEVTFKFKSVGGDEQYTNFMYNADKIKKYDFSTFMPGQYPLSEDLAAYKDRVNKFHSLMYENGERKSITGHSSDCLIIIPIGEEDIAK